MKVDTHSAFKDLIAAKMPEQQAEIIINFVNEAISTQHFISEKEYNNLVTKADLKVAISEFRIELKSNIGDIRTDIDELKNDMKCMRYILLAILVGVFTPYMENISHLWK